MPAWFSCCCAGCCGAPALKIGGWPKDCPRRTLAVNKSRKAVSNSPLITRLLSLLIRMMFSYCCSRNVKISRVNAVPEPVKKVAGHGLLELEVERLQVAPYAEMVGVRVGNRLNVFPTPVSSAVRTRHDIIDAVLAEVKNAIRSSRT